MRRAGCGLIAKDVSGARPTACRRAGFPVQSSPWPGRVPGPPACGPRAWRRPRSPQPDSSRYAPLSPNTTETSRPNARPSSGTPSRPRSGSPADRSGGRAAAVSPSAVRGAAHPDLVVLVPPPPVNGAGLPPPSAAPQTATNTTVVLVSESVRRNHVRKPMCHLSIYAMLCPCPFTAESMHETKKTLDTVLLHMCALGLECLCRPYM